MDVVRTSLNPRLRLIRLLMSLFAFAVVCIAMLAASSTAMAADQHSITVAPAVSEMTLDPAASDTRQLTIYNGGTEKLLLDTATASYTIKGDTYDPVYDSNPTGATPADWLTITSSAPDDLEPSGSHILEYRVDVPAGTPAGGYVASLVIETALANEPTTGVTAAHRIAHIVYINVSGTVKRDGSIESDNLPWIISSNQQNIRYLAANSGGTNEIAQFGLRVQDVFGRELLSNNVSRYVLPGTTRVVELEWEPRGVIGLFKVSRSCEIAGTGCDFRPSWQIYVHPIGAALVLALVLLYTAYIVWWQSRKHRRHR